MAIGITATDLKAFIPAKDFAVSLAFYRALGFAVNWETADLAELQVGNHRLLLQNYYEKSWAENCMLQLMVEDAAAWWLHVRSERLTERFEEVRATEPKPQPWGLTVMFLHDPSGVLWHITERPRGAPPTTGQA